MYLTFPLKNDKFTIMIKTGVVKRKHFIIMRSRLCLIVRFKYRAMVLNVLYYSEQPKQQMYITQTIVIIRVNIINSPIHLCLIVFAFLKQNITTMVIAVTCVLCAKPKKETITKQETKG